MNIESVLKEFRLLFAAEEHFREIEHYIQLKNEDPGVAAFEEQFLRLVKGLEINWGVPIYCGKGPAATNTFCGKLPPKLNKFSASTFRQTLNLSWWTQSTGGEAALLITGHDANTWLSLEIAITPDWIFL